MKSLINSVVLSAAIIVASQCYAQQLQNSLTETANFSVVFQSGSTGSFTTIFAGAESIPETAEAENYSVRVTKTGAGTSTYILNRKIAKERKQEQLLEDIRSVVRIYPNPATDLLRIRTGRNFKISNVVIVSITGSVVKSVPIGATSEATVDISTLVPGIYFITIQGAEYTVTEKFIKR